MSDYSKITDFAAKDSMLAGTPLKEITGTAHDNEYSAISVAIATKANAASPAITGTPTAVGATWTNLGTVTTADINGGTIDGTVIGGASAAAGTFTALSCTGNTTLGDAAGDTLNVANGSLTLDASGNLAVGGTPVGTTGCKMQLATASSGFVGFSSNTGWSGSQDGGLEIQRWTGTGTDYYGLRVGSETSGLAFYTATGAAIGSQTWVKRMALDTSGNLNIASGQLQVATSKTPASAAATGAAGEICWDADYIYVCVATNTWKRTAIATW